MPDFVFSDTEIQRKNQKNLILINEWTPYQVRGGSQQ